MYQNQYTEAREPELKKKLTFFILRITMNTQVLDQAYQSLFPYSKKYRVDFKRYLFSLNILSQLPDFNKKKFLDIGTGIGILPLALKNLGADVSGLDYFIFPESENEMFGIQQMEALQSIWGKNNIKVYNSNIYNAQLPPEIQSVDVVISEAMIEHLKDPKKFLTTVFSLLKPGGYLLLTTPNGATFLKRIRFLFGLSPNWPINEFFEAGENFTGHWREYTMKELVYMCEKSGFEIVRTYNKNLLTDFKSLKNWRKNIRAIIMRISSLIPGAKEMHYVLCKKK